MSHKRAGLSAPTLITANGIDRATDLVASEQMKLLRIMKQMCIIQIGSFSVVRQIALMASTYIRVRRGELN